MTEIYQPPNQHRGRQLFVYVLMIAATVAIFFTVRWFGSELTPPADAAIARGANAVRKAAAAAPFTSQTLVSLLVALAAVIITGQILGRLCALVLQPPVIGEILAGIALGPSILGQISPEAGAWLFPPGVAPSLSIVALIGVVLYMFIVGLELDPAVLRRQGHIALAISHASIVVPFALGAVLALWLYPRLAGDVPFTAFALFVAVSMSITAFPVLARILTDRQMNKTDLGTMALTCAATDDATAWCLLALVVGVARAEIGQALLVSVLTVAYIAAMLLIVRPLMQRWFSGPHAPSSYFVTAAVLVGAGLSAWATEAIGVHAIFGAFLFGAVIPHDSAVARRLATRLERLITTLFLPAFFAYTGMRTQIGLVSGLEQWLICLAIIAVATLGKFGGTLAAARAMGLPWRQSTGLGVLMNTRGLVELIVLNIGLDLGVISPTLFAMLVLMAVTTTMATSPILYALLPHADTMSAPVPEPAGAVRAG